MPLWFLLVVQTSALAFAVLAGVFFAFSDFIMRSLSMASSPAGVEVMQVINREVLRRAFLPLFMAMAPVSVLFALYGGATLSGSVSWLIVGSGFVYLLGAFGVTALRNVPLNKKLATFADGATDAQAYWADIYWRSWTFWNTVRTMACLTAAGMLLAAVAIEVTSL